jgi:hypothetical protein
VDEAAFAALIEEAESVPREVRAVLERIGHLQWRYDPDLPAEEKHELWAEFEQAVDQLPPDWQPAFRGKLCPDLAPVPVAQAP